MRMRRGFPSRPSLPVVRGVAALLLAVALASGAGRWARAETPEALHGETPRSAIRGFLLAAREGDWPLAASHLDLAGVPEPERPQRGPRLARRLKAVLDRTLWVDVDAVSDAPEGAADDGLPPDRDRIGTIASRRGPVDVLLAREAAPDGTWRWKVAPSTVAAIDRLAGEFGRGPLVERLPAVLVDVRFLEIELWQWIGLVVLVVLAGAAAWPIAAVAVRSLRGLGRAAGVDGDVVAAAAGPIRALAALVLLSAATYTLALAVPAQAAVNGIVRALTIVAVAWLFLRAVDVVAHGAEQRFAARGEAAAAAVVPLGRRSAKAFVIVLGGIALLQNLGFDVTGLLAGLGIGGLAVALAAQKTVENLFGGVTLIADRPVRVGDFCRFGDRIGTVEEVGLRSTRIRTLDRTVVSIPNAQFAALALENFTRRDRIWLSATLGLRYETTPDQLRHLLVELKRLLLAHPRIHPDPARVRFVGFGAYSLDVEIFAYVLTTDINEFLAIREGLYLRIMDLVAASGTSFAFPSQTLYAAPDAGLDAERGRAAEARVRRWRGDPRVVLPDVPPDVAAALEAAANEPPDGADGGT
jgi:MscS family membrane protein